MHRVTWASLAETLVSNNWMQTPSPYPTANDLIQNTPLSPVEALQLSLLIAIAKQLHEINERSKSAPDINHETLLLLHSFKPLALSISAGLDCLNGRMEMLLTREQPRKHKPAPVGLITYKKKRKPRKRKNLSWMRRGRTKS